MAEDHLGKPSEADMALITVSQAIFDLLMAAGLPLEAITRLLDLQQARLEQMKYPIAAGILGAIRQLAADPRRHQQREKVRKLFAEQPKGTA